MKEETLRGILHDWEYMLPIYEESLRNSTTVANIEHYKHMVEFSKRQIQETEEALQQFKTA
ncbi:hypothetical protein [Paenibacillus sp. FSL R7-0333]|uniref:hypothetical protein n=1 Tax=Paenibacillus sp. FSL R7-0333 TaxID=1926587 RepID=UPI00096EEB31|nr:hypothetical protein BK146_17775 [Paenibacillus sp. FSL R7-0333]